MTAVAVWSHKPSADELLQERLRGGWRPTPSGLKGGDWVWAGVHVNAPLAGQVFDVARPFSLGQAGTPVSVPVYVALGRYDFAVPYTLWDSYRGPFTNLTVKVFDRAGHTPQVEDSTAFDTEVLPWLRW